MEYVYIIDAGHGPETAGKRSPNGSLREFNFNHPTAGKLMDILKKYQNVKVYTVYDPNRDTALADRTYRANRIYAQYADKVKAGQAVVVYISIHANASGSGWNDASGIETYVYETKPKAAFDLAKDVQRYLVSSTKRKDRGVKAANFHVLRETDMPAILVESGFMTNKTEAQLLKTGTYQTQVAQGIANGLIAHYGLKPIAVAKPAAVQQPKTALKGKTGKFYVHVGAFGDRKNAEALEKKLKADGYPVYIKEE